MNWVAVNIDITAGGHQMVSYATMSYYQLCKLLTQYVEVYRGKCVSMHITGITLYHHEVIPSIGAEFAYICDCERRVVTTVIATKARILVWKKSTIYTDNFNHTKMGIVH